MPGNRWNIHSNRRTNARQINETDSQGGVRSKVDAVKTLLTIVGAPMSHILQPCLANSYGMQKQTSYHESYVAADYKWPRVPMRTSWSKVTWTLHEDHAKSTRDHVFWSTPEIVVVLCLVPSYVSGLAWPYHGAWIEERDGNRQVLLPRRCQYRSETYPELHQSCG